MKNQETQSMYNTYYVLFIILESPPLICNDFLIDVAGKADTKVDGINDESQSKEITKRIQQRMVRIQTFLGNVWHQGCCNQ